MSRPEPDSGLAYSVERVRVVLACPKGRRVEFDKDRSRVVELGNLIEQAICDAGLDDEFEINGVEYGSFEASLLIFGGPSDARLQQVQRIVASQFQCFRWPAGSHILSFHGEGRARREKVSDWVAEPLYCDVFRSAAGGPEIVNVHRSARGDELVAINYRNSGSSYAEGLHHVLLHGVRDVRESRGTAGINGGPEQRRAEDAGAMFDLGRTDRVPQDASEDSSHLQLVFRDRIFDVVCASVLCRPGPYAG